MRIGVVGLGFGVHLLHTLLTRDDCTVAAVCDHFPERLAGASAKGIPTFADPARMIAESGLDAVVIASAPHVREAALATAFERGLAVFLEKPLAGTPAQAAALVERSEGQRVMLGFSFRFHEPVRRLIAETRGSLGAARVLNAEYLFDWLPPADGWLWNPARGGGFFNENSCHLLDVVCALLGTPVDVHAVGFDDGSRPSATAAAATMRFANGAIAALTLGGVGTGALHDYPRLDLACAGGQARLRGRSHMWTTLQWAERGGEVRRLEHEPETLGRTRYSAAFDHFLGALRDGTPFEATPADGERAVVLAEAIYRSIASGEPVRPALPDGARA